MPDDLILLPSLEDYVSAFTALDLEDKITATQKQMLTFHHAAPGRAVSATTLAGEVGLAGYEAANLQYGKLAQGVCRELGVTLRSVKIGVLVDFVHPDQAANDHFLWLMRERVALALEELGWVRRVSQYLYPDLALRALNT